MLLHVKFMKHERQERNHDGNRTCVKKTVNNATKKKNLLPPKQGFEISLGKQFRKKTLTNKF